MPFSSRVQKAIKAPASQLASSIEGSILFLRNAQKIQLTVLASSELTEDHRKSIWDIFEDNMRALYMTSSFGWDPSSKQTELFDPLSRFILLERMNENNQLEEGAESPIGVESSTFPRTLVAYTMFRFEREDSQNVIYCYELQVKRETQRLGLGKRLTQCLVDVGTEWKMKKVMLTVFKSNEEAHQFYRSIGFSTDPTSPEFSEEDKCDYIIMSKRI
ncbi:hypothetical protein SERLA73DRAFT_160099 [Serpula lacrymans var. lacrymans S7.3]|uniref:N-alpha-acetyltransferase 40 n=2 Tax=Serpula lacrymans var. lacrymans TaxID=341189 RepID=F8PUM4_SERL3|nr:uncharacterized protein SERLADRAFT_437354 [Serpula lacrymans var. lacrymans S7.9]EGO00059.1 hypothetical protein SERLA73DRAFT_160099 [Serpula lacrymans var. lacrymans S7.3]EGO25624.1 hypothetical protein SERLADRAFT_437354 [Serpula lacrymans var. lacrymans S7.9]